MSMGVFVMPNVQHNQTNSLRLLVLASEAGGVDGLVRHVVGSQGMRA
jgi:hypothetical protein